MTLLLKVSNLKTYYFGSGNPVRALDGVSFEVPEGKTFAVVGESGCGKSTLALSLFRLVQPPGRIVEGGIFLGDQDLAALPEKAMSAIRGRRMGLVLQDSLASLNPALRVGTQISEVIRHHFSRSRKQAKREALMMLERVGLPEVETLYRAWPHALSGGQRQRVAIAIALACKPQLLVLDEPTTALDASIQNQILLLLKELQNEMSLSIVLITHDLGVVAQIAHFAAVMYAGKIVEQGRIEQVFRRPAHPYTRALLSAAPSFQPGDDFQPPPLKNALRGSSPDLRQPPAGCAFHPRCPEVMAKCKIDLPVRVSRGGEHNVACFRYE